MGSDAIDAGAGDDSVTVADGIADSIDCGPGSDATDADQLDQIANCERVSRHEVAPPAGQPPADDAQAPTLRVSAKRRSASAPGGARSRSR